jgi:DNA-binding NtrC family response regulator
VTRSTAPAAILLVEDDESLRKVLGKELSRMGHSVHTREDAGELVAVLQRCEPDVVLLDLHLPGLSGMEALRQIALHDPDLPVVVCTGHGTVALAVQAMQHGAFDFLTKPVSLDVLEQTVDRACAHGRLVRDNLRLRRASAHASANALLVGSQSPAARRLDQHIARIAKAEQSVLITGESGSGKELVARRLHASSARHDHPFVVVHCGAVPRQLIESELFGHLKGSFTGADQKRLGLFEAADGGTLFLDEVGELPLELQPALLRAVQFGEIRSVGSDQVRHVDVRLITATHRDLRAKVQDGSFREDLFYRLAVLEIAVPPLRERTEDIPDLARAFLAREAQRAERPLVLDSSAVDRLQRHGWPGNVRELENAIVRLGVLVDGPQVTAADVDEHVFGWRTRSTSIGELPTLALHELEGMAIRAALQRFDGNKPKAAAALGIALKTLYNKLNAAEDAKDAAKAGDGKPPESP